MIFLLVPFVVRVLLDVQIDDIYVCAAGGGETPVYFVELFSVFFHIC